MNSLFMKRYGRTFREAHGTENAFDAVQRWELARHLNIFYIYIYITNEKHKSRRPTFARHIFWNSPSSPILCIYAFAARAAQAPPSISPPLQAATVTERQSPI